MKAPEYDQIIDSITDKDLRYGRGAYYFIRKALDFTVQKMQDRGTTRNNFHVTGQELLDGIREFALDEYGPMTLTVFENWNIKKCEDFGEIVFNLVETGVFGKTADDHIDDFGDGYDFHEAFAVPFLPETKRSPKTTSPKEKVASKSS